MPGCSPRSRSCAPPARRGPRPAPSPPSWARRSARSRRSAMPTWPAWPPPPTPCPPTSTTASPRSRPPRRDRSLRAPQPLEPATAPVADPEDGVVYQLAQLDQEQLWAAHAAAVEAQAVYEAELASREDETDPDRRVRDRGRPPRGGPLPARGRPPLPSRHPRRVGRWPSSPCSPASRIAVLLGIAAADRRRGHGRLAAGHAPQGAGSRRARRGDGAGPGRRRLVARPPPPPHRRRDAAHRPQAASTPPSTGGPAPGSTGRRSAAHTSLEAAAEREDAVRAYAAGVDPKARAARARVATRRSRTPIARWPSPATS